MVLINNILQFLGFGWEYYHIVYDTIYRDREICTTRDCRINKYTGKVYKRIIFSESKYGYKNWVRVKEIPKNLIKV